MNGKTKTISSFKGCVSITPMAAPRPRLSKFGTYNDPKYTAYKKALVEYLNKQFSSECKNNLGLDKDGRKTELKKYRYTLSAAFHRKNDVGDLDNYIKGLCDAMEQSGLLLNDKKVLAYETPIQMTIDKANPRIEFELNKYGVN